jgi:hypothetical protein
VGNILAKTAALRINLNIDDTPIASQSHTHPSHSQTSRLLTSSPSLGVPVPPLNPTYSRRVDLSTLTFSLSSHRYSYFGKRVVLYECQCDERLEVKSERSTRLTYTVPWGTVTPKDRDEVSRG